MPGSIRYPDSLRQQAIALSRKGKGYKAISTELGIKRDTVRSWITTYRLTGRTESVQVTGQMRTVQLAQQEEQYAKAREEYETSTESLLSIAKKHGLNYNNLRHFLQQHHPESACQAYGHAAGLPGGADSFPPADRGGVAAANAGGPGPAATKGPAPVRYPNNQVKSSHPCELFTWLVSSVFLP
ncbi:MAG: transposase [Bacteroidales bacterium]|nr:transposase [Bacteroidales bacterium]